MVAPLGRVAMRRPGAALFGADPDLWHYGGRPDPPRLRAEFDALTAALRGSGVDIEWIEDAEDGLADAIFTCDPSFVVADGAILLRPGKPPRRPEVALHRALYERLGIPVLGEIEAPGTVEGGDLLWLDERTLAAGLGFRTNAAGLEQLRALSAPRGVRVLSFDLPVWKGEAACLHLLSLLSPLDVDLALVHRPLLPVALDRELSERGIERLEAPADEFLSSGGLSVNVLALGPRDVLALDGFPKTARTLRDAGCDVTLVPGEALCLPLEGGPTCLTRPLLRSDARTSPGRTVAGRPRPAPNP